MSDEALRALERAAAADPARTLEWARALERAGRADEAWLALCRAVDEPDVRSELAARPMWARVHGPGETHALDVPPIRAGARLRWVAGVTPHSPHAVASPAGVVTTGAGFESALPRGHQLFDPRDGRERSRGAREAHWLDGQLVLGGVRRLGDRSAVAFGRLRADVATPAQLLVPAHGPPILHRRTPAGFEPTGPLDLPPELRGRDIGWPWTSGGGGWLLTAPDHYGDGRNRLASAEVIVGPTQLVVTRRTSRLYQSMTWAFDLASRAPVWRGPGEAVAVDAAGALLHEFEQVEPREVVSDYDEAGPLRCKLTCVDLHGARRWSLEDGMPRALGRDVVLADLRDADGQERLLTLDRTTGRTLRRSDSTPGTLILVRDVVIEARGGRVSGVTLDGIPLWDLDLSTAGGARGAVVRSLAALPAAIIVGLAEPAGPGRLACVEGRTRT